MPRQPFILRVFYVVAGLGLIFALAHACSGSNHTAAPASLSTVRARAVLTSSHPVSGHVQTGHAPLTGDSVIATAANGQHFHAPIGTSGIAVLRVPAGQYVVTTSAGDACPPYTLTVGAAKTYTIDLDCVAGPGFVQR